jgi:hypothetical protein
VGWFGFLGALEDGVGEGGAVGHQEGGDGFAEGGLGEDGGVADGEGGGAVFEGVEEGGDLGVVVMFGVVEEDGGGAEDDEGVLGGSLTEFGGEVIDFGGGGPFVGEGGEEGLQIEWGGRDVGWWHAHRLFQNFNTEDTEDTESTEDAEGSGVVDAAFMPAVEGFTPYEAQGPEEEENGDEPGGANLGRPDAEEVAKINAVVKGERE